MKKVFGSTAPAAALALVLLVLPAIANLRNALAVSDVITVDFGVFMASGRDLRSGADPYRVNIVWKGVGLPNLNPPIWLPLFGWMSQFDRLTAYNLWRYANLAIYLAVAAMLFNRYRSHFTAARVLWVLAPTALNWTLYNGQVYILILAALAGAWLCLEKRAFTWAGIWIGIAIALKPNFAVWLVLLVAAGYWRLGLTSAVAACLIGIVPAAVFGLEVYHQWLAAAARVTWLGSPGNASLPGLAHQLRLPWLALPLAAALLAILALFLRRCKADPLTISAAALPASLLLSPVAWHGYTLALLPVFLSRRWSPALVIAAGLLVLPYRVVDWWVDVMPWPLTVLGSFSLAACLLTCAHVVLPAFRGPRIECGDEPASR